MVAKLNSPPPGNILITGVSGYIGMRLLTSLTEVPEIQLIAGTDIRPPFALFRKFHFYSRGILEPLDDILLDNHIDTIVHLAFILKPTHQVEMAGQVDVAGTANLLKACRQARVKHLLYLSSHTVYGAFPDNPASIREDWPVRPLTGFQYAEDKIKVEKILQDFCREHPETRLTILRTCPVIGPHAAHTISTVMMQPPLMMRIRGYDPPMQFVHEDDLIELMKMLILKKISGVYNVANDGVIQYSEVARLADKKMLVLPEKLIRPVLSLSWKLHLQNQSPAIGLEFIKYPPVVSTEALRNSVKYRFRFSAREAVASFLLR